MAPNKKSLKIVTEDFLLKIMMNYQNGSLKMKRNTISKSLQSLNKSSLNKKKD